LVGRKLGMEVPWMKRQSTRATLVEEHIEISRLEVPVYEEISRGR
jgi:hypothetical protein